MGEKMDKKLNLKMLEEMTLANGVSGFEDEAVEVAKKYISPTLEVSTDSMLNTYITRGKVDENLPFYFQLLKIDLNYSNQSSVHL